jgi:hypothetical protein
MRGVETKPAEFGVLDVEATERLQFQARLKPAPYLRSPLSASVSMKYLENPLN